MKKNHPVCINMEGGKTSVETFKLLKEFAHHFLQRLDFEVQTQLAESWDFAPGLSGTVYW